MKQPDSLDIGTKMDVVRHRLNVAREDLETELMVPVIITMVSKRGCRKINSPFSILHIK